MRYTNLTKEIKYELKEGNPKVIKKVLRDELENTKNDLVTCKEEMVRELQGKAKDLVVILELLGE